MSSCNKLFIIVDAYGPGRYFRHYLQEQGYLCVHLLSTLQPLPRLTLSELEHYDGTLIHGGDFTATVKNIENLLRDLDAELCEVLPGVEPGVLMADKLSHHFKLHSNGIEKSLARRDKNAMADVLSAAGIPIPSYCRVESLQEAQAFARSQEWPIVLKPLDSAGTNGVHFCHSEQELADAFHQVMGAENNMGTINQSVLLQSFLQGKEYMVNTVSHDGQHYMADIWYADKTRIEGYAQIYNKNHLVESQSEEYTLLRDYVFQVLDALGIKYGPAHAEVIITPSGPKLVEIASRISGVVDPLYNQVCLGHDQITLTLESYLEPQKFLQHIGQHYHIKKRGLQIMLSSRKAGKITALDFPAQLDKISSVVNYNLKPKVGDMLVKTFDLSSSPGMVNLAADDESTLLADYQLIQQLFEEHVQVA
ncbi:ATP-grasp domain-containing protein [Xenorhabdus szentirmaii]|uniref:Phosphoribosylglycinamide synthetase n=2 Tax=Xenorhabdus szentirmaii TaxID=290112 RepID=W1J4U7_9GAMM|nr:MULTISPECIES: ATP-grasp domain-containing protein [Xenorhabdus]MBD2780212.1 ATP-grasp domain-containing protein [Xenorhabdus sp. 38]MBD2800070.1 ATP-grasp domain-containing protein [Xenorhabdus sp. M]MBD2804948.1 ATP-grasp domain-containing protein [Xenorhabdus sp. ZM]MBD2820596.1 ATP-grasp domain-containing protein [Xenorhabdus sp. 42]MBD2824160.1 ATP-grasp domain-containing protein [Xenorhabdus sp. 5]